MQLCGVQQSEGRTFSCRSWSLRRSDRSALLHHIKQLLHFVLICKVIVIPLRTVQLEHFARQTRATWSCAATELERACTFALPRGLARRRGVTVFA